MNYRNVLLLLITIMLAVSTQITAQELSDYEVKQEAKKRYPELFLPKDEFETTAEYNQRLKLLPEVLEEIRSELIAEKIAKQVEAERLATERSAEIKRLSQIKIAESLAPVKVTISAMGKYNADGELGDYIRENVSDMAGMLDREQTPGLQTMDREKVLIQY